MRICEMRRDDARLRYTQHTYLLLHIYYGRGQVQQYRSLEPVDHHTTTTPAPAPGIDQENGNLPKSAATAAVYHT